MSVDKGFYSVVAKVIYEQNNKNWFSNNYTVKHITKSYIANNIVDAKNKFVNFLTQEELTNYISHVVISVSLLPKRDFQVIIFYTLDDDIEEHFSITVSQVQTDEQAKGLAIQSLYEHIQIIAKHINKINSINVYPL